MKEFVISKKDAGQRIDKYLKRLLPGAGTSFLYKMLRKKNITRNDQKAEGSDLLEEGDVVRIFFSDDTFEQMSGKVVLIRTGTDRFLEECRKAYGELNGIRIFYEDDDCVIFGKPAGILTQKASPGDVSLNEYLIGYLLDKNEVSGESLLSFRPSVQNRLDRNTKGLVVCAKTLYGSRILSEALKSRDIKKIYRTTVRGRITEEKVLDGFLLKDEATNKVNIYDELPEDLPGRGRAVKILTRIAPIRTEKDRTDLEVELITGKTHQIRAHLSHIGHPILGDTKYGDMGFNRKNKSFSQDLTAYRLVFPKDFPMEGLRGKTITYEDTERKKNG